MTEKSVYIHIPFCKKICSYCDFCKFIYNSTWVDKYLNALKKEIDDRYLDNPIKTIYIGGGTPSSLSINELNKLFEIIKCFKKTNDYEFSFECNLNDINEDLISLLVKNGVNRISIGVESFNKNNLDFLNRSANFKEALQKINICKELGLNNINVDLIYAIPKECLLTLKRDLKYIKKLNVNHVSTYSLMIEDHTVLKNNNIQSIPEEVDYKMYKTICHKLKKYGYNHYEISNFAKKGYESKHNLVYWNNEEYYGFGLGASGYIEGVRYDNTKSLTEYLKGNTILNKEILSEKEIMDYEIILGLRKTGGINTKAFYDKYHVNIQNQYKINELLAEKDLIYKNGNIFINPDKLYIMNEILVKLI